MTLLDGLTANQMVATALDVSGWTPDRSISTAAWATWFDQENYKSSPCIFEILGSLGGLTIDAPRHAAAEFFSGSIFFDPEIAAAGERKRISSREAHLGQSLCPLAQWSDVYILLFGEHGQVFAEAPGLGVLLVGGTFVEALAVLITANSRPQQILP